MRVVEIGRARLFQADALEVLQYLAARGERVDGVFTDPPYSSGGMVRGDRAQATSTKYQQSQQRDRYAEFSGDTRDQRAFAYWCALWIGKARELCSPGALAVLFTDWRQLGATQDALQAGGFVMRGVGVWDKTEAARPQPGRFRQSAEFYVWGTNGPRDLAGSPGPGVVRLRAEGAEKEHMTQKPEALMRALVTLGGETVLDPFMGSGTTGAAAASLGRAFIGCELVPHYFDVACRRIEAAYRAGADMFAEPPVPPSRGVDDEAAA